MLAQRNNEDSSIKSMSQSSLDSILKGFGLDMHKMALIICHIMDLSILSVHVFLVDLLMRAGRPCGSIFAPCGCFCLLLITSMAPFGFLSVYFGTTPTRSCFCRHHCGSRLAPFWRSFVPFNRPFCTVQIFSIISSGCSN